MILVNDDWVYLMVVFMYGMCLIICVMTIFGGWFEMLFSYKVKENRRYMYEKVLITFDVVKIDALWDPMSNKLNLSCVLFFTGVCIVLLFSLGSKWGVSCVALSESGAGAQYTGRGWTMRHKS